LRHCHKKYGWRNDQQYQTRIQHQATVVLHERKSVLTRSVAEKNKQRFNESIRK
jgi:hypothetical protein